MSRPPSPTPPLPTIKAISSLEPKFSAPPRSSTLPQQQPTTRHRLHHQHHHPHRSHPHHRHNKSVPQSAIERTGPNPFGDLLRRHRGSNGSDSGVAPINKSKQTVAENNDDTRHDRVVQATPKPQDQEHGKQRARAQAQASHLHQRRKDGEASLKSTMNHLSDLSTTMTRRLDYTYYTLLTSFSLLTRSVELLHALAKSNLHAHGSFVGTTAEIERSAETSLQTTQEVLDRQAERVSRLQERMDRGKSKVEALRGRLGTVNERLEEAERVDGEGRKRVGRRWRMLWSFVGFWASVLVIGLFLRRWGSLPDPERISSTELKYGPEMWGRTMTGTATANISDTELVAGSIASTDSASAVKESESSCAIDADATLRLLDEV